MNVETKDEGKVRKSVKGCNFGWRSYRRYIVPGAIETKKMDED